MNFDNFHSNALLLAFHHYSTGVSRCLLTLVTEPKSEQFQEQYHDNLDKSGFHF